MDASVISALAALAGATIGGFTSVVTSWFVQRTQAHARWLAQVKGESVDSLIKNPPPGAPVPPILPPVDGYLFSMLPSSARHLPQTSAKRELPSLPTLKCLGVCKRSCWRGDRAAWKTKPSHYLVATEDKMIPPAAQRQMAKRAGATIEEAGGSHAIYISKPEIWLRIAKAAKNAAPKLAVAQRDLLRCHSHPETGSALSHYAHQSPSQHHAASFGVCMSRMTRRALSTAVRRMSGVMFTPSARITVTSFNPM
jgi:hypothetical protein